MKTVTQHIRDHLLSNAGLSESEPMPSLEELQRSEWSPEFEKLMRNRLIMGCFRYGALRRKNKPKYNKVDSMQQRLDLYREDGNAEHLVDIANLCLVEFVDESHPNFNWSAQDDKNHVTELQNQFNGLNSEQFGAEVRTYHTK